MASGLCEIFSCVCQFLCCTTACHFLSLHGSNRRLLFMDIQLNTLILNTALASNTLITGFLLTNTFTCFSSKPGFRLGCSQMFCATIVDAFVRTTFAKPIGTLAPNAASKIGELAFVIATIVEGVVEIMTAVQLNNSEMLAIYREIGSLC